MDVEKKKKREGKKRRERKKLSWLWSGCEREIWVARESVWTFTGMTFDQVRNKFETNVEIRRCRMNDEYFAIMFVIQWYCYNLRFYYTQLLLIRISRIICQTKSIERCWRLLNLWTAPFSRIFAVSKYIQTWKNAEKMYKIWKEKNDRATTGHMIN